MKELGQKVRVAIPEANRATWATGAFEALQGRTGVVIGAKTRNEHTALFLKEPCYLVEFSPALPPLWSQGSQVSGHWFDESEIEVYS